MADKKTVQMPALHREAQIVAGSLDEKARTFDIVWSAGAEVPRMDFWTGQHYVEVLEVSTKAIRTDRLESGRAPVLDSHSRWSLNSVLGVVEKGGKIEGGQARATVRMSNREDVAGLVADIRDGIIANVSPGYITHSYREELRDGTTYRIATDWEPIEISFVPVGADPDAGLARSAGQPAGPQGPTYPCTVTRASAEAAPANQETEMSKDKKTDPVAGEDATRAQPTTTETPAVVVPPVADAGWSRADIAKITARGTAFGLDASVVTEILADEKLRTIDQATDALQERAVAARGQTPRQQPQVRVTADEGDKLRAAVGDSIALRANPDAINAGDQAGRDRVAAARQFRGMSILEAGRDFYQRHGVDLRGLGRMELSTVLLGLRPASDFDVGTRAAGLMSTSDFANILANVASKRLRDAYAAAPQTWRPFCRQSNSPDFKTKSVVQLSSAPKFKRVREGAEFTYGGMTDGVEQYALATYGRIVPITRQALINDDLAAFDRLPTMVGRAAATLENATVYGILLDNAAMNDSVALFHADHGNLMTGSAIDETNLALAEKALMDQTGLGNTTEDKEKLILHPAFMITGTAYKVAAQKILTAVMPTATSGVNVFAGSMTLITDPNVTGNKWFVIASPAEIDTIEYAYLDGEAGVFTEQRVGFEVDGIELKGRLDFAAKAIDHRGMVYNPGA